MRDISKYDTQDLKTVLSGRLDLELPDDQAFWALKTISSKQFAVFAPCENSDEPSDKQRRSLRLALKKFKSCYERDSKHTEYELIVPLYLSGVGRWVLLHIEPAFLGKNTRVTLYDPKGFWNRRPLSYVRNVLSEVFGTRSIKKKRMGHQSNNYDDGTWVIEYAEALLNDRLVMRDVQKVREKHVEVYNNKNKKNAWEVKHQLVQPRTFWQKHRIKILVAVVMVPVGVGVLTLIGLAVGKAYREFRLWQRRRKWRQRSEVISKNLEVEKSDLAGVESVLALDSRGASKAENLTVPNSDGKGKNEKSVGSESSLLSESEEETKLEESGGDSDRTEANLSWLQISNYQDDKSAAYIKLLNGYLFHKNWKPKGTSLFSDSPVYEVLRKMRGVMASDITSDTDVMYELSEIAAAAKVRGEKQILFLEKIAAWQKCETLSEVRESVYGFKELLDTGDNASIIKGDQAVQGMSPS